jgi:hypothetical protein
MVKMSHSLILQDNWMKMMGLGLINQQHSALFRLKMRKLCLIPKK